MKVPQRDKCGRHLGLSHDVGKHEREALVLVILHLLPLRTDGSDKLDVGHVVDELDARLVVGRRVENFGKQPQRARLDVEVLVCHERQELLIRVCILLVRDIIDRPAHNVKTSRHLKHAAHQVKRLAHKVRVRRVVREQRQLANHLWPLCDVLAPELIGHGLGQRLQPVGPGVGALGLGDDVDEQRHPVLVDELL